MTGLLIAITGGALLPFLLILWPSGRPPAVLTSLAEPAEQGDFSDLPTIAGVPARDGTQLAFRAYTPAGRPIAAAVLIHGSSADSRNMHGVGRFLANAGVVAYAVDIRGHGATGRRGDIDYVGQIDDDIEDLLAQIKPRHRGIPLTLIGFSSGGGYALRVAATPRLASRFDRFLLLAPFLHHAGPTARRRAGGWVKPNVPRIVGLSILARLNVPWFQHLPVLAFALPRYLQDRRTLSYSYRLQKSFRPYDDFLGDVRRIDRPARLLIGERDQIFVAEAYKPLLEPIGTIDVEVLPGLGHLDLIKDPGVLSEIATFTVGERAAPSLPHLAGS